MKKFKRIITGATALVLFLGLAACSGKKESPVSNGESNPAVESSAPEESKFPLEEKNFGGKEITVYCVDGGRTYGELQFVDNPELEGNVINNAVKYRNDLISEKYGLTMKTFTADFPIEGYLKDFNAGLGTYDIICDTIMDLVPAITQNVFLPLDDYIDLNADRWDSAANETLTFNDRHYLAAGDAILTDDDYTYLLLFNRKAAENNPDIKEKYGSLYELAEKGEWTFDVMFELAKGFSAPDENGEYSENAKYGISGSRNISNALMNAAGLLPAEKTEDGNIILTLDSPKNLKVFSKLYDMLTDRQNTFLVENFGNDGWDYLDKNFIKGNSLFYSATAAQISKFKNYESDMISFGVLPNPKYEKEQERYYHTVNAGLATVLAVSPQSKNIEESCYLLELLAYYGKHTPFQSVNDAYYQTTLKLQAVEKNEDAKMLDLVFNNRIYDTYAIMPWGSNPTVGQIYGYVLAQPSNTLVSVIDANREAYEEGIKKTLEEFKKMNG